MRKKQNKPARGLRKYRRKSKLVATLQNQNTVSLILIYIEPTIDNDAGLRGSPGNRWHFKDSPEKYFYCHSQSPSDDLLKKIKRRYGKKKFYSGFFHMASGASLTRIWER